MLIDARGYLDTGSMGEEKIRSTDVTPGKHNTRLTCNLGRPTTVTPQFSRQAVFESASATATTVGGF